MVVLSTFFIGTWSFKNKNFVSLNTAVLPEDKEDFYTNFLSFDYAANFENGLLGVKKYLMNDDIENVPKARIKMRR